MPRSPRFLIASLAATFALLALAGTAQAGRTTVVGPGGSIQAAVDAAEPGDTIVANLITHNLPSGDTDLSGGVVVTALPGFPTTDNDVRSNVILRNDPDILWDGSGPGNVFDDNLCRTSIPPDLCG